MRLKILFVLITSLGLLISAQAAPGDLDWSFGTGGKVITTFSGNGFNRANGVVVQPDQKILVAGTTTSQSGVYRFSVVRYTAGGTIDTAFGNNGIASVTGAPQANVAGIILQPDGKIVVGGTNWSTIDGIFKPRFSLIRFNADGTPDTGFDGDGKVIYPTITPDGDIMRGIAMQADGKIVATGQTGNPTPQQIVVLRSNSDGTLDTSFDGDGIAIAPVGPTGVADFAEDILIQPDEKILIVGNGWETGRDVLLIRYNSNGSLDTDFGGDGIVTTRIFGQASYGYAVALQSDGKIVVAGQFINAFLVLRYQPNGTPDTSFDGDGFNYTGFGGTRAYPSSLAIQNNGKILLGGYADIDNGNDDFAIARFNSNGSLDTSFDGDGKVRTEFVADSGITDKIYAMTLQADGKLIAVGEGATFPPSFAIARYVTSGSPVADFDGDTGTDISIFRASVGEWWYMRSSDHQIPAVQFGTETDKIVPADFTGDGKTDIAFWRESTGEWFIIRSEDNSFYAFPFGSPGDIPAPGDFDGDGKADAAVFRPSNSTWYIKRSSDGGVTIQQFGIPEDKPVVSDYDGDGKDDIAIFRPSVSEWWILRSTAGLRAVQFGQAGDKTVQGDYTGDGKADIAFWRPADGFWYILRSEDNSFYAFPFGLSSDIAAPGDYDGDGKFDAAVFRPSSAVWYLQRSSAGSAAFAFGINGDQPIPGAFVR